MVHLYRSTRRNLLEVCIGRNFGALEGLNPQLVEMTRSRFAKIGVFLMLRAVHGFGRSSGNALSVCFCG